MLEGVSIERALERPPEIKSRLKAEQTGSVDPGEEPEKWIARQIYPTAAMRYPTPGSLTISRGLPGSTSSLRLSARTATRR